MPEADTQAPTPPSASSLVANALQTGKPADFTGIPDDRAAEKTVSASFIREAIVRSLVEGPRVRLAMVIKGAIIEGDLSLSGLGTSTDPLPALDLSDCTIKGALDLSDSAWVAVTLDGCALRGLTGQRLRLETSLSARDLSFETVGAVEIDLADLQSGSGLDLTRLGRRIIKPQDAAPDAAKGACFLNLGRSRIGGMLQLGGARLKNPDGDALNLDNADVAGHLHLRSIGHQRFAALGTVWMFSARIGGQVNGVGLCVVNPKGVALAMNGVEVRGHVLLHRSVTYGRSNLTDAKIGGQIDLSAAHIVNPGAVALNLDRADIASHLLMFHAAGRRFASKGAVSMDGAHVGGSVTCYGARIDHSGGYALSMSRMHVVGDVSLCASEDGRFEARGGVQAVGIRVDGLFNGNGGRFVSIHAQRSALTLESATIGGALFIRRGDGFRAEALGEVKAFGATIGGNVECSGAKLVNRRGNALWMEGAEVGGSLLLRQVDRNPFIAIGEVNLRNLKVAGSAAFDGTFSCHGTSDALDLESTHIGTLRVRLSPQSKGVVSLAGAQVDELDDFGGYGWGPEPLPNVRGTGPVGVMLKLDGFNYRRLGPWRPPRAQGLQRLGWPIRRAFGFSTPRDRWWHRVQWLERQYVGSKPVADDFFPQPHEQLAKVLHLMGHDYDARRIMTHRFAHESRCRANEFVSRFFMRLYRWGFGCGYLPIRAFTTVVLWLLIGWGGVTYALHLNHAGNVIFVRATTPVDIVRTLSKPDDAPTSSARSEPYPEFKTRDIACDEVSPLLYALDTMLPVFQLHMESKCEFTDNTRSGRIGRHVKGVFSLLGWIIVTLAALTWTGVLRREPA